MAPFSPVREVLSDRQYPLAHCGRGLWTQHGKQSMLGLFTRSDKTMSSKIASHKRSRAERIALDRRHEQTKLRLHYPLLIYYRWREKRAYSHLLSSKPATAEDAYEKLIYVMALMTSKAAPLPLNDVQQAVTTLRPFGSHLAEALGSRSRRSL